ncbi:GreA/GreB family elongation factor [Mariprofundus aestuarium]|uniref:GreA/GreB family elongation factor n=1 Tax=Mariprofundus aestuarium TaxID=1921086 RepID=A0A2K8KW08_MARES|nr:GreA/GreB family elongation factor [Mariprofundus aestuarium]ATX79028.1 GreA/GreB family elongation factor [Mariprofundus aestuarium]
MKIDKSEILALMIEQLRADLATLEQAVAIARDTATHSDCLGSSKYETMGLEASYLAQGQGTRLLEVERSLEYFKRLTLVEPSSPVISLSSLVLLNNVEGECQLLWLAPEAGGLKIQYGELIITVITPRSPLGRALIGKAEGDGFEITIAGKDRSYEVSAVC